MSATGSRVGLNSIRPGRRDKQTARVVVATNIGEASTVHNRGSRREKGGVSGRPETPPLQFMVWTSGEVETIEVHDLGPRGHEVTREFFARAVACIDFGDGAQL